MKSIRSYRKLILLVLSLFIGISAFFLVPNKNVQAQAVGWQKGSTINPRTRTDFLSEDFHTSLKNLASTGADYVTYSIPLYQSTPTSIDLGPGSDTPTDEALISAIQKAHALGMKVMLKFHPEILTRQWRANINPPDRAGWFKNYGDILTHYGHLSRTYGVEQISLGAELKRMTLNFFNPTNTSNWSILIDRVRAVYPQTSGKLTYGALMEHEFGEVGFWGKLDYMGLTMYPSLDPGNPNPTFESLIRDWELPNATKIRPYYEKHRKPVLITEIGYRSISGSNTNPYDYNRIDEPDHQLQALLYDVLFSYWTKQSYFAGIHLWDWQDYPNRAVETDTSFSPQFKPAQAIMTKWFKTATPTPTPLPSVNAVSVWWPKDGSVLTGVQPFKASILSMYITQYKMYWQVNGGQLNEMGDYTGDLHHHKKVYVSLKNWTWRGTGPYTINFVAKDLNGNVIAQKAVTVTIQH